MDAIGPLGVHRPHDRRHLRPNPAESAEAAAELEELGYAALWIPDVGGPVFDSVAHLLASTTHTVILNLWMHEPSDVAASYTSLTKTHGERSLVGIGCSHAAFVDSTEPGRYRKPLAATRSFLDALDAAEQPVPVENRVLAALGPKMLELAATRTRGAHPYRSARHRNRLAAYLSRVAELRRPRVELRLHRRRPVVGQRQVVRRDHRVGR
jgi:probable F420-dependent oxidoreductase